MVSDPSLRPEISDSDVDRWRADTPAVQKLVHFNNAGAGLMPTPVLAAMKDYLDLEAEIGGYEAADAKADAIAGFYAEHAGLVNAAPENLAFLSSATHAFDTALSAIPFEPGDVILTTRNDYISNQIAFMSLRKRLGVEVVRAPDSPEGGVDVPAMVALMRERRPRVVSVTHVPTNSGLVQPVAEIGLYARELELLYLVDACQSVGQLPVDVEELGCDFLTATSRKFLRGPRGAGFLYASNRVLSGEIEPLFIDMRGADWTSPDEYAPSATAKRFEQWEMPYALVVGAAESVRYARAVGIERIAQRAGQLATMLRDRLREIDGTRVLDKGPALAAIVTFTIDGWEAQPFKSALQAKGINSSLSSRSSAQYDFADKNVEWALRLSPHYYNTEAEVDRVTTEIAALAKA
ncbi:aminotransferase class V-fold PLP-dependent enzyme [Kribbella deserti]|uniref:Aminotransferase class V-fold PLP-dependent enzyme n=1 Tax=Kribbella deserti TaxID=1926257 RepID=A0ABV6QZ34_9ACTN